MGVREMLIFEEGWEQKAYPDPLTGGEPWTIGVGHTGPDVHEGTVWTDRLIGLQLDYDIALTEVTCMRTFSWYQDLNPARRAVILGMMFQMGKTRLLKFVNTLAAVAEGRYADAAKGMRDSVWARQTPKRAIRMAEQMESGVWNPLYIKE